MTGVQTQQMAEACVFRKFINTVRDNDSKDKFSRWWNNGDRECLLQLIARSQQVGSQWHPSRSPCCVRWADNYGQKLDHIKLVPCGILYR